MNTSPASLAVIDATFVLAYLVPDQRHEQVDAMMARHQQGELDLVAPPILSYDVCNGLLAATKVGQIDDRQAAQLLKRFVALEISSASIKAKQAYQLAQEQSLSFYDAAYVQLSYQNAAPLLTMNPTLLGLVKLAT